MAVVRLLIKMGVNISIISRKEMLIISNSVRKYQVIASSMILHRERYNRMYIRHCPM